MKKTTDMRPFLLAFSLAFGAVALTGCSTDDSIDLNEIDANIGIGSDEFTLPASSTAFIKLADILSLNDGDCVETTATGDYQFRKSDVIDAAKPTVEQVLTVESTPKSNLDGIPIIPGQGQYLVPADAPQPIRTFTVDTEKDDAIIDIDYAALDGNVKIGLNLSSMKSLVSQFDMDLYMPRFFVIDDTGYDVDWNSSADYYILKLKNISTAQGSYQLTLPLKRLEKFDTSSTEVYSRVVGNRIKMNGDVKMQLRLNDQYFKQATPGTTDITINEVDFGQQIVVTEVQGRLNPDIEEQHSTVNIGNDVPDFLNDDKVKILLNNPTIALTVSNNINIRAFISGQLIATYKDGRKKVMQLTKTKNGSPIRINEHTGDITSSTISKIVICRKAGNEAGVQYVVKDGTEALEPVESENDIAKILEKIPKTLSFTFNSTSDQTYTAKIDLCNPNEPWSSYGRSYELKPSYDFVAELNMDAGSTIVYNDTINEWNSDINDKDVDLLKGTKVEANAKVINRTPMKLYLDPVAIDVNKKVMSDVKVEVTTESQDAKGYYIPSAIGTDDVKDLKVVITAAEGALKRLDGLILHVTAETEKSGYTLNSGEKYVLDEATGYDKTVGNKAQIIKIYDLRIGVNGKVTINLDKK